MVARFLPLNRAASASPISAIGAPVANRCRAALSQPLRRVAYAGGKRGRSRGYNGCVTYQVKLAPSPVEIAVSEAAIGRGGRRGCRGQRSATRRPRRAGDKPGANSQLIGRHYQARG